MQIDHFVHTLTHDYEAAEETKTQSKEQHETDNTSTSPGRASMPHESGGLVDRSSPCDNHMHSQLVEDAMLQSSAPANAASEEGITEDIEMDTFHTEVDVGK